jgi:hypothetical protein
MTQEVAEVPQKKEFEIYGHHVHVSFLNHDF